MQKRSSVHKVSKLSYQTKKLYIFPSDGIAENGEDIADFSDSFIDADVHVRKVTSVAQCLKIIADRLIEEKPRSGKFREPFIFLQVTGNYSLSEYERVNFNEFIFIKLHLVVKVYM